jgi:hypothetical protein
MHDFFVNRLSNYFGNEVVSSFWKTLCLSTLCSLMVAVVIEKLVPHFSKALSDSWFYIDERLANSGPKRRQMLTQNRAI